MLRNLSFCLALAVGGVSATAIAASDPILVRQKIMKSVGGAAGASAGMMKGEIAFDPKVANLALRTLNAAAYSYGNYFPEGSQSGMETRASPKIWQDMAGFEARLAKFQQDTDAAAAAEPKELEAFKAVMGPVLQNCKACHEAYRVERN